MMKIVRNAGVALAVALVATGQAHAQVQTFSGNVIASGVVTPNAGCAPIPNRGVATGSGSSNFGSFSYSHTVCTQGATGPVTGSFLVDFGVDELLGTLNGSSVATATAGIFDQTFLFLITGGNGRFDGATGSFNSIGTVDARTRPSQLSFTFGGLVNVPPVPEPSTWAMMLVGFGAIGVGLRRRRARHVTQSC